LIIFIINNLQSW